MQVSGTVKRSRRMTAAFCVAFLLCSCAGDNEKGADAQPLSTTIGSITITIGTMTIIGSGPTSIRTVATMGTISATA
jgi:hypothetical protein